MRLHEGLAALDLALTQWANQYGEDHLVLADQAMQIIDNITLERNRINAPNQW